MSKDIRIMNTLSDRLKTIDGSGTFNTNLGDRVYLGRLAFDDEDTYPILTIEDSGNINDTVEDSIYDRAKITKRVTVHGLCDVADTSNPNISAYLLISDIKKAIFSGDQRLDGEVMRLRYSGSSVSAREDSATKVGCTVDIVVAYAENLLES